MTKKHLASENVVEFEDPLSNYDAIEYESDLQRTLAEETVDAIEPVPFVQVKPTASVREAIDAIHASKASSLLVVSEGKLLGIFTERDVIERVAERFSELANTKVCDVMTANPTVVYETDPIATALAAIVVAGHRHVPVLTIDGTLCGSLSPRRVFSYIEGTFDVQTTNT